MRLAYQPYCGVPSPGILIKDTASLETPWRDATPETVRLVRLDGDSLVVLQADTLRRIPVEHITEMRLFRKSELIVAQLGRPRGAMEALTGSDDEVYNFTPLEFADRLRAVQKIFLYHPVEPKSPLDANLGPALCASPG